MADRENWELSRGYEIDLATFSSRFFLLDFFPHVLERSLMVKWNEHYMTDPY
jgi:hypothetical protein